MKNNSIFAAEAKQKKKAREILGVLKRIRSNQAECVPSNKLTAREMVNAGRKR